MRNKAQEQQSLRRYSGGINSRVRLVCFPWCGAGASVYRRLALHLPPDIEVFAVQLPGREERFNEERFLRLDQVVNYLIKDLITIFDRPLVLFGHSLGALIAYEIALALKASIGREPNALIVSGHGVLNRSELPEKYLHRASDQDLIAVIRNLGGTPTEIIENSEIIATLLPLLRADYEILETYLPQSQPLLTNLLIACAGKYDQEVSQQSMEDWQKFTAGPFKSYWFDDGHFYLNSQSVTLAKRIQEWIALVG